MKIRRLHSLLSLSEYNMQFAVTDD